MMAARKTDHASPLSPRLHVPSLVSEEDAIERLGLQHRKNPKGALRWLIKTKRLKAVRIGRGILSFRAEDLAAFVEENYR